MAVKCSLVGLRINCEAILATEVNFKPIPSLYRERERERERDRVLWNTQSE